MLMFNSDDDSGAHLIANPYNFGQIQKHYDFGIWKAL